MDDWMSKCKWRLDQRSHVRPDDYKVLGVLARLDEISRQYGEDFRMAVARWKGLEECCEDYIAPVSSGQQHFHIDLESYTAHYGSTIRTR